MSQLSEIERFLLCLAGTVPEEALHFVERDYALKRLREMSGQDFGVDVEAWRQWFQDHPTGSSPLGSRIK